MTQSSARQATMKDVAKSAGVSIATVSRYVNGLQRFSEPTRIKIREAIDRLGFRVDPVARSMVTGRTHTIAVVILDIRNPHFTGIVKGANRKAQKLGYNLLFVDTGEQQNAEAGLLRDISRRVDGLIVSSRMPDAALSILHDLDRPVVFFGRASHPGVHSVSADGRSAAAMVAHHLLDLGHQRIAYLGYPAARWDSERKAGLVETLSAAGKTLQVFSADLPSLDAGEKSVGEILMDANRPDAVVCFNDLLALGFMKQAQETGFRIPDQLSVVGFDDIPFSRYVTPSLTTVDMQSEIMGEIAMERLIALIDGSLVASEERLKPRLVVRESTARRNYP